MEYADSAIDCIWKKGGNKEENKVSQHASIAMRYS